MDSQQHGEQLKRGLKNRHIQIIALGGAIGTGLFLGSASVIQSAGPGIILGYAIAGFIAFLIMRQLGEMVVEEPVAGSFSHFAYKYWGRLCRIRFRLELLGAVRISCHGGTDRSG
ncbi:aromatic amino acid transporter [Salmonella enterica subsp. enterica]|nr:aromatic amino acid transporter [Salmonella enterica subsp. enterica]